MGNQPKTTGPKPLDKIHDPIMDILMIESIDVHLGLVKPITPKQIRDILTYCTTFKQYGLELPRIYEKFHRVSYTHPNGKTVSRKLCRDIIISFEGLPIPRKVHEAVSILYTHFRTDKIVFLYKTIDIRTSYSLLKRD